MNFIQSTISRKFNSVEENFSFHANEEVMLIAFIINFRWKRKRSHLISVAWQFDALEFNKTLHSSVDIHMNFTATLKESEQRFIAEL